MLALPEPSPQAIYVIEASSYQLDLTDSFAPDVAILTNISPDHLDRHGGMEGYVAAKRHIFTHAGLALVGVDEAWGAEIARTLSAQGRRVEPVCTEPSPLGGEGGRRSRSDEGAVSATRAVEAWSVSGSPLIRLAVQAAFSHEGRRITATTSPRSPAAGRRRR